MTGPGLSIVVGNPKPASRTLRIANALARRIMADIGARHMLTVDLISHARHLFEWPNAELTQINERIAASDIILFASPTYKASYTGLLKALLDRYANNALAGALAVPIMTAGSARHAMAVEFTMRPLLVELGAAVPTRGFFFNMEEMGELDAAIDRWAIENLHRLRSAVSTMDDVIRVPEMTMAAGNRCG